LGDFFVFNVSFCACKWQKNQFWSAFCQFLWLLVINIQCFVVEFFLRSLAKVFI
jgi:hypothetical protein